MPRFQTASLSALGALGLLLLAGCTSATVKPRPVSSVETQQAELKGSDVTASDAFGVSVAVSGDTLVAGTSGASYAGRAYVFTRSASGWSQVAELKGSDTAAGDAFGSSVAISGSTIVVGAYDHANFAGRAYVFADKSGAWKQLAELKGSDTVTKDLFGWSVAVSGATAIVGAVGHGDYAGRAYVFADQAGAWSQTAELTASDAAVKDGFGTSVAVSGGTAIVGAEGRAKDAGAAFVFTQSGTGWTQVAELKGSDTVAGDNFGTSVALAGKLAVVGAYGHATNTGRAYVFSETSSGWKQLAELKGSDTVAGDYMGISAAISGTTVVIGAYDHASQAGRAYLFRKASSGWTQTAELKGSDTKKGDFLGVSAGISGTTAVVGANGHANRAGRVYVFKV
jgi:nucleoside-specific outer membrane channel protein Tsx